MGIRFRRSMKIAPGVRVNVTKSGWGVTVGGKGARYSVHSSGRRTRSFGLPGTGLYYQEVRGGGHGQRARSAPPVPSPSPADLVAYLPKPGFLASGAERAYYRALVAYFQGDHQTALAQAEEALARDPAATSAHLIAGVSSSALDDDRKAIGHLEAVVASDGRPDRYSAKFLSGPVSVSLQVKITDAVQASAPFGELGAALSLAELYQAGGRLEEAIGLMQQLHGTLPDDELVRLSLCDLLFADKDYEGVVELTTATANDSDLGVETLHIRGASLMALGHFTAAIDAFRAALAKTTNRDPALLNAVRYDRASAYEQAGQRARAQGDLERLYAADPGFEDVKERLAAFT
jgi:tetratricopeptide (TPR) repeat protein